MTVPTHERPDLVRLGMHLPRICLMVSAPDRAQLEQVVANGNTPQKLVNRVARARQDGHRRLLRAPLHLILDNASAHKSAAATRWARRHPRFYLHFIPTSSSWLNLVERWFAEITRQRIRRGTFESVPALITAIREYLEHYNHAPRPFVLTKDADTILAKIDRVKSCPKASNA